MTLTKWRDLALSFAVAGVGAFIFHLISFPSAPLTGGAVAVTIAGIARLRTEMPVWMRNGAFILLGINIGTAVTPEMLASAAKWPLSIAVLLGCLVSSMWLTRLILVRHLGFDRHSAALASAPGHLSFVLSLSIDGGANTARIAIVQSIRVLFISLFIPVFVSLWFGATGADLLPPTVMTPLSLLLAFSGTLMVGLLFIRFKLPAAYLLAGMLVSSAFHVLELTPGRMPETLNFAAFLIMGILIGSRFSGQKWIDIKQALAAGFWVTGINMLIAFIGAAIIALSIGIPMSLLIVAFAPGGVEAMAAIAVMLGIDPAFVAAHHVARLVLLTFLIPIFVRRFG